MTESLQEPVSRVFVSGLGAVSPAGWNIAPCANRWIPGEPLPVQLLERPGWDTPLRVRHVPDPAQRLVILGHPGRRCAFWLSRFLACPEAGYITGSVLKVDGGILS